MTPIFIDAMYAITLGLIIGTMAAIQNPKTKALVFSLPLPITVTMLATGAHITSKISQVLRSLLAHCGLRTIYIIFVNSISSWLIFLQLSPTSDWGL